MWQTKCQLRCVSFVFNELSLFLPVAQGGEKIWPIGDHPFVILIRAVSPVKCVSMSALAFLRFD